MTMSHLPDSNSKAAVVGYRRENSTMKKHPGVLSLLFEYGRRRGISKNSGHDARLWPKRLHPFLVKASLLDLGYSEFFQKQTKVCLFWNKSFIYIHGNVSRWFLCLTLGPRERLNLKLWAVLRIYGATNQNFPPLNSVALHQHYLFSPNTKKTGCKKKRRMRCRKMFGWRSSVTVGMWRAPSFIKKP